MYTHKEDPTENHQANSYLTNHEVINTVNYIYDHEASMEFIMDSLKAAFIAGQESQKEKKPLSNFKKRENYFQRQQDDK